MAHNRPSLSELAVDQFHVAVVQNDRRNQCLCNVCQWVYTWDRDSRIYYPRHAIASAGCLFTSIHGQAMDSGYILAVYTGVYRGCLNDVKWHVIRYRLDRMVSRRYTHHGGAQSWLVHHFAALCPTIYTHVGQATCTNVFRTLLSLLRPTLVLVMWLVKGQRTTRIGLCSQAWHATRVPCWHSSLVCRTSSI